MTLRAPPFWDLLAGALATPSLVVCLAFGLGNDSVYASLAAGSLFFIAALLVPSTVSRRPIAVLMRLLIAPVLFFALYCQLSGWSSDVLVFMSIVLAGEILGATGGLLARGASAARQWPGFAGALAAMLALVGVLGWYVPRATTTMLERTRERVVRYRAPPYAFTTLDGQDVDASALRGKVVVLDFWAAWCNPCLQEWPGLNALIETYKHRSDVAIYAIASRDNETLEVVRRFLDGHHYDVKAAFDASGRLTDAFHAHGMPTLVMIDGDGDVRYLHAGYDAHSQLLDQLRARIEALLAERRTSAP
jgi:thiol-disulfide isomerase/thioredoxin